MASAAAALPLIGTVVQTVGAVVGALNEAGAAENQADQARQLARREQQLAAEEARDFRLKASAERARSMAAQGAGGVNVFEGSSLLMTEQTFQEMLLGERRILTQGQADATQLRNQADMFDFNASGAKTTALFAGLSGAAQLGQQTNTLLANRAKPPQPTSGRNPHTGKLIRSRTGMLGGGV